MDFSALIASYRPPSPVEADVLESLQRSVCSRRPLRFLADSIIRGMPFEEIQILLEESLSILDEPITKGLRLLHYAAFQRDFDALCLLLQLGADPNLMDEAGYTPLHICAEKGYNELIELLVEFGARIRFTELNPNDEAHGDPPRATIADEPLRLAIRNEEHETVQLLLEHGANPNALYYLGHEINLVNPMDTRSIELLLAFGADPNARDLQGLTPLMKACRNSQALDTLHLLVRNDADVNAMSTEDHRTSLHYAVLFENLQAVEILIGHNARVCFPLEQTRPPPLYFAVLRGNCQILELLLSAGADVNAASTVVGSALHLAMTEKIPNQIQVVKTLLRHGANPNAVTMSDDRSVLKPPIGEYLQCCEHPDSKVIRELLKYGARIVMQGQRDHPLGIIKVIHRIHLGLNPEVLNLLIDASEAFSIPFIEQSRQMSEEHKTLLLTKALQPFTLKEAARIGIRKKLGWGPKFVDAIEQWGLPLCLKKYLLFQE
ncbi:ankyrin repeat domain-containing protein 50-like isoform X2 [Uloborus diversus]|uniref:ankyrin repeat domain-containing protein 50-like isoform X2 n=1 Tax=Uloborus diversus TaxID=327109 RepID=UPI0024098DBC|nr:ankyrin repeat domain-containing protein 50-like isoform X2 [Uloborus diversus]